MKRKFLILTLCFTIIFSSINFKKSYAMDFVVSPILFTSVVGLGVATGLVIDSNENMYDFVNTFLHNSKKTINEWNDLVKTSVVLGANGLLTFNKLFIDSFISDIEPVYGKLDDSQGKIQSNLIGSYKGVPIHDFGDFITDPSMYHGIYIPYSDLDSKKDFNVGDISFNFHRESSGNYQYKVSIGDYSSYLTFYPSYGNINRLMFGKHTNGNSFYYISMILSSGLTYSSSTVSTNILSNGFVGGFNYDYSSDKLKDNQKEDGSVAVYVPGNLGDFVGTAPGSNVGTNENSWQGLNSNGVTLPQVSNPSVDVVGDNVFPNVDTDISNPSIPDINNPSTDIVLPSFPSFGDSLDFSPMYLTNVTEKFPFSLPWDIGRLIQKFDVEPVAPVFEVPIVSETITLDLTEFSELASIVRFFILIGFILALIFISTKLMA